MVEATHTFTMKKIARRLFLMETFSLRSLELNPTRWREIQFALSAEGTTTVKPHRVVHQWWET